MKKILSLLLIMSLAVTVVCPVAVMAEETEKTVTQSPDEEVALEGTTAEETAQEEYKEYNLSLEGAIELALTDNPQLIANEFNQKANKININSVAISKSAAKRTTKAMGKFGIMTTTTIDEICLREGYYVTAAKVQHELSVIERDRIIAGISYNVTNAYYNVVLMDMLVAAAKNSYSLAIENKSLVDAQYEQGFVPQMSYDNAGISVDAAKSKLEAYELNRDIAMRNLKNQLNVEPDCTIYLTDGIEISEFSSDVDADVISAMETRYDIIGAKKAYELSAEYFDLTGAFTENSAVYNTAYADMLNKEFQYNSAKDGIELAIRASYNTIISNHAAMGISERTCDMAKREYDAAKLQYELGMITNLELTDKIYSLYEAEVSLSQAKLNYTMAVEKYKYDITIGLPQ